MGSLLLRNWNSAATAIGTKGNPGQIGAERERAANSRNRRLTSPSSMAGLSETIAAPPHVTRCTHRRRHASLVDYRGHEDCHAPGRVPPSGLDGFRSSNPWKVPPSKRLDPAVAAVDRHVGRTRCRSAPAVSRWGPSSARDAIPGPVSSAWQSMDRVAFNGGGSVPRRDPVHQWNRLRRSEYRGDRWGDTSMGTRAAGPAGPWTGTLVACLLTPMPGRRVAAGAPRPGPRRAVYRFRRVPAEYWFSSRCGQFSRSPLRSVSYIGACLHGRHAQVRPTLAPWSVLPTPPSRSRTAPPPAAPPTPPRSPSRSP